MIEQLVYDSPADLTRDAALRLSQKLQQPRSGANLRILLTGGTLGIQLLSELAELDLELAGVQFFFGDERFVPILDSERNEAQGLAVWPKLAGSLQRFPDSSLGLEKARAAMSDELTRQLGALNNSEICFDLVILGMGPDGHVASLFPGREHDIDWIVAERNSPKPPGERLSFSYQALNRAAEVWFLVSGAGKADAVRCALTENCDLPAARVSGRESTTWFMDSELRRAL